jgi:hypothetical protein
MWDATRKRGEKATDRRETASGNEVGVGKESQL